MTIYLVATLVRYVLVEAEDETQACERGYAALCDLYADMRKALGKEVPVTILTVRPATDAEIGQWNWHHEMLAGEGDEPMYLQPGQRIELVMIVDDPDPIEPGTRGTVRRVAKHGTGHNAFLQVDVAWDNGRSLMLSVPPDRYRIVDN